MKPPRTNLLCPLDWGLGHASRSLALADRLTAQGETVHWASSGPAAEMLRRELPGETIHELPGYRVTYGNSSMAINVARQAWKWFNTARQERRVVARLVKDLSIDRIISDNRFGCYHKRVPSVFLTHQLHPITHFAPASALYKFYLRPFNEYWVPDEAGPDRLSGKLSDGDNYNDVSYIGPLSRLYSVDNVPELNYLLLLSGPEPDRTRLENQLMEEINEVPGSHALVRGLPARAPAPATPPAPHVSVYNFADRGLLSRLMSGAHTVVCRSGYSSMMDLRALNKRAILIPTPGQTEQLYLAQRAAVAGWATHRPQASGKILP